MQIMSTSKKSFVLLNFKHIVLYFIILTLKYVNSQAYNLKYMSATSFNTGMYLSYCCTKFRQNQTRNN